MPLASSREASLHRASLVKKEKKEEARRHRLSLPYSIDSSTCVNESNAERRRSLRRQSSGSSGSLKENKEDIHYPQGMDSNNNSTIPTANNNNENNKKKIGPPRLPPVRSPGPTPYWQVAEERGGEHSPRTTRSNSKKSKREDGIDDAISGTVLMFSPPNQAKNACRQAVELRQNEEKRMQKIEKARENGHLLEYLIVNRELVVPPSDVDVKMESNQNKMVDNSAHFCLELSPPGDHMVHPTITNNANKKKQGNNQEAGLDRQTVDELKEFLMEQIKSNGMDRSQQEAQLVENAVLMALNKKLEQTADTLQQNVVTLQQELIQNKETYLVEKVKIEAIAEATSNESKKLLQQVEIRSHHLDEQIGMLREEKRDLKNMTTQLESEIARLQDLLKSLQAELTSTKDQYASELNRLEHLNLELTEEVGEARASREELEQATDLYERRVQDLERNIQEYRKRLEETKVLIEKERVTTETAHQRNQEMECEITQLKNDLHKLTQQNDEERLGFQALNEDSTNALEKLQLEATEKDSQIGNLFKQLGELQQAISAERLDVQQNQEKLQHVHDNMKSQIDELSTALEETMAQLDVAESERKDLKVKLTEVDQQLERTLDDQSALSATNNELRGSVKLMKESLIEEERRREKADVVVSELERQVKTLKADLDANNSSASGYVMELERQLKIATEERDAARTNMKGHDQREEELYRKLCEGDRIRQEMHAKLMRLMGNIRVFVRVRPPLPGEAEKELLKIEAAAIEKKRKRDDVSSFDGETPFRFPGVYDRAEKKSDSQSASYDVTKNLIEVREPHRDRGGLKDRRKKWTFGFDKVFSPNHGHEDVWEATEPLIQCAVDGYNVTIFAYGQTGSGKTYTMLGDRGHEGIIGRAVKKLFQAKNEIQSLSRGGSKISLSVELLEVYNEKVRDLLAPDSGTDGREISLKVTSKEVVGNIVVSTNTEEEVMQVLDVAQSRRCVKATNSNLESSRSHMLFTIHFDVTNSDGVQRHGKLNICDLAGSERLGKSGTHLVGGSLLEETKHINLSLSVLSNVIERLQAGDSNIPYRDSKLTFLLKDSLSGNSKTLAIVCCNPLFSHVNESISSLRFAEKVSRVDLKAMANFSF